jgi:hypothetical protein
MADVVAAGNLAYRLAAVATVNYLLLLVQG